MGENYINAPKWPKNEENYINNTKMFQKTRSSSMTLEYHNK